MIPLWSVALAAPAVSKAAIATEELRKALLSLAEHDPALCAVLEWPAEKLA